MTVVLVKEKMIMRPACQSKRYIRKVSLNT